MSQRSDGRLFSLFSFLLFLAPFAFPTTLSLPSFVFNLTHTSWGLICTNFEFVRITVSHQTTQLFWSASGLYLTDAYALYHQLGPHGSTVHTVRRMTYCKAIDLLVSYTMCPSKRERIINELSKNFYNYNYNCKTAILFCCKHSSRNSQHFSIGRTTPNPPKLPLLMGDVDLTNTYGLISLSLRVSCSSKRHLDRFGRFQRPCYHQHTDKQTMLATSIA